MYYFVNKEKYYQIFTCLVWFYFTSFCSLLQWNWEVLIKKVIEIFQYFTTKWKIMSDSNMSHRKTSDFVSFLLLGFTLVIKVKNFDFESHWNALIYFDKKKYCVRFEWKNDFVLLLLFWFILVIQLRNFDFESHRDTLIYIDRNRYGVGFQYVPRKNAYFISFPWFGFILVAKLKNFNFEGH